MAIVNRRRPRKKINTAGALPLVLSILVISALCVLAFKWQIAQYYEERPDIYWTVPSVYYPTVPCHGILFWKEKLLPSPASGMIKYPLGRGPVRVAKGDTVAIVAGVALKVDSPGYFVAGLDGHEGKMKYGEIWNREILKFEKANFQYFKDGILVNKGSTVGKLVLSLLGTRFIGTISPTPRIAEQIKKDYLYVKDDETNSYDRAVIRTDLDYGKGGKRLYMDLPFFRLKDITNRVITLQVDAGQETGALFPISCIVKKNGKLGVLRVRSQSATFTPIVGIYIKGEKFLASEGVEAGQPIVLHPEATREGRVKAK